ncbi:hypothetical protein U1Q18_037804 [Sarracenia purpurea var. burkii]
MSKHSKGIPENVHTGEQTSSKEAVFNEGPDSSNMRGTLPVPDKEIPSQSTSVLEKVDMVAAQASMKVRHASVSAKPCLLRYDLLGLCSEHSSRFPGFDEMSIDGEER